MIRQLAAEVPVGRLCRLFGLNRSAYYGRKTPCKREQADQRLMPLISQSFQQSRQSYGSPRILDDLRQWGQRCGRSRVQRLMRQLGLRAKGKKKFKPQTTRSDHQEPIAPNRLLGRPAPTAPDQVWVTDITYVACRSGWLYLAAVMDLYSRRIVGWSLSRSIDSCLVESALRQAISRRRPPGGLLLHSDRGSQYASANCRRLLEPASIIQSMSRRANCYDNAAMESFWARLKTEWIDRQVYDSASQAQNNLFEFIEVFYNRRRKHSSLGYLSPVDFENKMCYQD